MKLEKPKRLTLRLKIFNIQSILLSVFLILSVEPVIYAQAPDSSKKTLPRLYCGLNVGMLKNSIMNEGDLFNNISGSEEDFSFSGSLEFGYYFSKAIGISTGLGYSFFSANLLLDTYNNKYITSDSENETYEQRITGSGITETQKLTFLNIPVVINFRLPSGSRFQFFIQSGISLSFKLNAEYASNGTFTYSGYYPEYNSLLQDLPAYGFVSNKAIDSGGNLEINSMIINGLASAGFQYLIADKIQIAIGCIYSRSLSTISDLTSPESFQLSPDPSHINSMMEGSTETTTRSLGMNFSVRYYFK